MRNLSIRLVVAVLAFLTGSVAATLRWAGEAPEQGLRVFVPDSGWVRIWFESTGTETKSINELTAEAGLADLKTTVLPGEDLEARLWVDAGPHGRAIILRRSAGRWSAIRLRDLLRDQSLQRHEIHAAPRSGWEGAWARLVSAGILTLPDASQVQCRHGGLDGVSYIVEVNTNKTYRTYKYSNPDYAGCEEAGRMLRIAEVIEEEFGWEDSGAGGR